jgi:hypothetical protein
MIWREEDIRTHLHKTIEFGRLGSLKETKEVIKREFGHAITKNMGLWFGAGTCYFHDFHQQDVMNTFADCKKVGDASLYENKSRISEAAIIFDENRSLDCISLYPGNFIKAHNWDTVENASFMGAPADFYLLDDIDNPLMPDYKLYIFLNAYYITEKQREAISAKVKKNGSTVVWCYAPGYLSQKGFSTETMRELTGMSFKEDRHEETLNFEMAEMPSEITKYALTEKIPSYNLAPVFSIDDKEAKILGFAGGKPALAVKEFKNWKCVYSLMPLTKELLMGLCDYAGVHVYSRTFDVLSANKSYLMLHAVTEGKKTIFLPDKCKITEILTDTGIGQNISEFSEELQAQSTRIYKIDSK